MQTVTSVSGGKTSAYLAAKYPTNHYLFALIRVDDKSCAPKDKKIIQMIEDKIKMPFVGTLEEHGTLTAVFDLEQHIGHEINWVSGKTFEQMIADQSNYLPNKLRRFCTQLLKVQPMFEWSNKHIGEPVEMHIGYRANETNRAKTMQKRCNANGFVEIKHVVGKHKNGNKKWRTSPWYKPRFPLIEEQIMKYDINNYWNEHKDVRFARLNNCVGCFFRSPVLLKKQSERHPEKFDWFVKQEQNNPRGATWRKEFTYADVKKMELQLELDVFADIFMDDIETCESGFCGL